jgi:hypothetical protein
MPGERYVLKDIGDDYTERYALIDTQSGEEVALDGGEPEDQSFQRDWSWVPPLLNRLDAERAAAEQRADLAEREVERLRKHVCADGHHPTFLRGTCIRCGVGAKETP